MKSKSKRKPIQVILENGEPSAVILDIDEYKKLLERAEDAEDLRLLEKMRRKPLRFRRLREFLTEYSPSV